jgi:hypothetical protein
MSTRSADKIHRQLNPYFKSKVNPNWKSLVEAIGEIDEETATLIQEVRKQFFIQTAERPYIDRLGANLKVSRPPIVGMSDTDFRKYIPIVAYQPKQVKLVIDQLLDVFFFKEATTAFATSTMGSPFILEDKWELIYKVDGIQDEHVIFSAADFTNINSATVEEIAASINRQAKYSFAIMFDDRIQKKQYIRLFTKTVGSKGSIEMLGGRANIFMQFTGTISGAGSAADTQWLISKIGDTVTYKYVGGTSPSLGLIQASDLAIIDMPGNSGTFVIASVDLANSEFSFVNLFGTPGSFDHSLSSNSYVRFMRPQKSIVWNRPNRAAVWEVAPGEIVVEMPATPPVVRRELKGSAHLNGNVATMTARPNNNSITIDDASEWPTAGVIVLEPKESVDAHILTGSLDINTSAEIDGRYNVRELRFTYTGKTGNSLTGLSPSLPRAAEISEIAITSISRVSNVATAITAIAHNLVIGQSVRVLDMADSSFDGTYIVSGITNTTTFSYVNLGANATSASGYVRSEFVGLANSGSKVYLTTAKVNTGILGPYLWDASASFVLSSYTGKTTSDIKAGNIVLNLEIAAPNNIPADQGFLIFDYGLETQEGPVRYLYKASDTTVALDPSYVFKFDHTVNSSITAIRRRGAHVLSGLGTEYAFYVSDPSAARAVLQDLIKSVKSVGVFIRYLIRFPENYYGTIDLYQSGIDPG